MWFQIARFPKCEHHLFLSHSREDSVSLVTPTRNALFQRGVLSWIDLHEYPYGRSPTSALRDSLFACRHIVFFITSAMLQSARGWCCVEYTLAKVFQDNFERNPTLSHFVLPLFFVERGDSRISRSVWNDLVGMGKFIDNSSQQAHYVDWAEQAILDFLRQEQQYTARMNDTLNDLPELQRRMPEFGLIERATRFDPSPIRFIE